MNLRSKPVIIGAVVFLIIVIAAVWKMTHRKKACSSGQLGKLKLAGSGPEKTGDCKASGDGKWLVFPNSLAQNAQGDTLDESTLTGDVEAACQARCANNPNCNVWAAENSTGRCVLFPDASDPITGGYAHWTTGVRAALLNK